MLYWIFRILFLLVMTGVLVVNAGSEIWDSQSDDTVWNTMVLCGMGMTLFVFLLDVFTPKKKLSALAGVFFGLLVGLIISGVLAPIVDMLNESWRSGLPEQVVSMIKTMMGICVCFLTISVVMRTKDDVRFVVPYVEFAKQVKGARPLILDTSAIVDGRVADLCQSKIFDAPIVIPRFVLNELQLIADSADKLKRNRGRRGLDILKSMQESAAIDVEIDDTTFSEVEELKGVDQKLVAFTKIKDGRLATTDYNLSKVAQVRGVDVVNINDLASSLKVVVLPGEPMTVKVIKPGEEADQGIGYLEDGTMVVVEGARDKLGKMIHLSVTSSLQTSAGKMIFGKFENLADMPAQQNRDSHRRSPRRYQSSRG